jgi:hypothetical protein
MAGYVLRPMIKVEIGRGSDRLREGTTMNSFSIKTAMRLLLVLMALTATGGFFSDHVSAEPKTVVTKSKSSIRDRRDNAIDTCDAGGGSATATTVGRPGKGPFGGTTYSSTVTCSGGDFDGMNCTFTKGKTSCTSALIIQPDDGSGAVTGVNDVQLEQVSEAPAVVVDTGAPVGTEAPAAELPAPSPTIEPTIIDSIPTVLVEDAQIEVEPSPTVIVIDTGVIQNVDLEPVVIEAAP